MKKLIVLEVSFVVNLDEALSDGDFNADQLVSNITNVVKPYLKKSLDNCIEHIANGELVPFAMSDFSNLEVEFEQERDAD